MELSTEVSERNRARERRIIHSTSGNTRGPIRRLVSPGDLGELIKPFIFLDEFKIAGGPDSRLPWHPHSGLATLTVLLTGDTEYEDSTGQSGHLSSGSVEWMRAGAGVWHTGRPLDGTMMHGFQLWVSMPPTFEHAPAFSQYIAPGDVEKEGPVTVLLGQYGKATSRIETPSPMNYFIVELQQGEHWRYDPPAGHTVAWAYPFQGRLHVAGTALAGELAVFDPSTEGMDFQADGITSFLFGSAVPHAYPLVTGYYSVHTSEASLVIGEAEIARIGKRFEK